MRPPTVLHVDDDDGIQTLSRRLFEQQASSDVTVLTASTASGGLELIETRDVDCLVSDSLTLADGTPFVVAASERAPDLPIVLFTASEWADVKSQAHEAGVAEYVHKSGRERMDVVVDYVLDSLVATDEGTDQPRFVPATNDWTCVTTHDWESDDDLGTSIVLGVEAFADVDASVLPPLYESVDADALEELLEPRESSPGGNVDVRFDYEGYEILVTTDGAVLARRRGAGSTE
jgi:CheY-like chemotaxis protein